MDVIKRPEVSSRASPRLVLAICCASILLVGMDTTMVNVALPSIAADLGGAVGDLQWLVAGYTVALASFLIAGGSLADRFGRVRVFRMGLSVFSFGSLICVAAPSVRWLVAGRVLQGLGGSMMNPVAMSIIRVTFDDPADRARAIGVWAAVVGIGMAIGPVLGGPLAEVSWRVVFLINVPVGITAIVLVSRFVPESRAQRPRRADPVGQLLVVALLALVTTAGIEAPAHGWGSGFVLGMLGAAAVSGALLIRCERRRHEPLIDLRFFSSRPFAVATLIAVIAFASFGGFLFLGTLYLQDVRGLSPTQAGMLILPLAAMTALVSPVAGRVVAARGVRVPLVVAGLAMSVASFMLTSLSVHTPVPLLVASYALFGLGFGAVNPPITTIAVAGMPASQAGVAAAVASTSRQIGQTLGVAGFGSVLAAGSVPGSASGSPAGAAQWVLFAIGVIAMAIAILGLFGSAPAARASAENAAELLA